MLTLLQISDLHFGPLYLPDVGEALLRAAAEIRPDVIVASGDFTQRANRPSSRLPGRFSTLPPVPQIVVPGNHDIPLYRVHERLFAPYACIGVTSRPNSKACSFATTRRSCVDTTAPLRRITDGRIKPRQLELVSHAFQATPAQSAKIVVAHHHFAPSPDSERKHDATARRRPCNVSIGWGWI